MIYIIKMTKTSKFLKPWIENLEQYVPGEAREGYIKLASNENNYGPSPQVIKAIKDNAGFVYKYIPSDIMLTEKIAEYCGVNPENVIAGNGSDEVIDMIFKTFNGPVLSFYPSFSEYKIYSELLNEKYCDITLESDFSFDVNKFIEASTDANILVLCTPNNPTGEIIKREYIEQVLCEGKITVVDEAYFEFSGESIVDLIKDYENLIVIRTFSKAFALAGLRAGYAIGNEKIIRYLYRVKPPFNVNSLAQVAAITALDDLDYMNDIVNRILGDRKILEKELGKRFRIFPSHANFILIDVSPITADEFYGKLLKNKIIVRNFGRFKGFDGEYIRITIGTNEENEKLVEVLNRI